MTGATGKTGKSLIAQLGDRKVAYRAATRSSARPFDWTAPETWDGALEDVSSVYLVAPPTVDDPYSRMIEFLRTATQKGARRFVFLGMASLPAGGPAHGQVHQWLKDNSGDWAVLAPSELGLNFSAMVFVTLREVTRQAVADFEAALPDIPQIVEAQRLFGDPDYLLHVIAKDLPAYQQLYDEYLSALPNVQRLVSTLVMKRVIHDRVLPL